MSSQNEANSGASAPVRRERRNWRLRTLFAISRRPGPLRYWPLLALLGAIGAALILAVMLRPAPAPIPAISYSELATALAGREVAELTVEQGGSRIVATLRRPRTIGGTDVTVVSASLPLRSVSLADLERWSTAGARVRVRDVQGGRDPQLAIQVLSLLVLIGIAAFFFTRVARGGVAKGKFTATPPERQLTLADVGGAREAQADLRDIIAYLKDPKRFDAMGAKCPKGVLLVGPPGTGKTLLARAVAGEAGRPVITAAGSDFNEMYVGVGARRVRQLAKLAREQAPCIVFIDEFDSLGGRRGRPNRSGEEEVTLNQLLVEMDGLAGSEGIIWMAATNREDMLDPAVRRPGRFDRVVEVALPTQADRLEILRIHSAQKPLAADVDLDRLASLTVGHSGADLANLLNEATIIAVHEECETITASHIDQARDKILLGRLRSGVVISEEERRLIAVHEAGHAIVGLVACPDDKLHKVTIEPRGRSLGAAHFAPEADRHLYPKRYLEGVIAKALGGRAAELAFFGPEAVTSGAGSDLVQATNIARRMVAEFGMSPEVGLVSADASSPNGQPSGGLQSQIDSGVRALITTQAERAEAIVREHRSAVDALATALLDRGVLPAGDVIAIAEEHGVGGARDGGRGTRDDGRGTREASI
ncbi:MAG TPA: AAA family ATPase [Gemmatimonadaceae bacterium]|nr:AAA family ATPase [Gemmatimonadaceae bacterium]